MVSGWENLRVTREELGLTMRDVETASGHIAQRHNNEEYLIPISRLSDFETKGVIPSIYRLYSMAAIYRRDFRELLSWYDVEPEVSISDLETALPPASHLIQVLGNDRSLQIPVRMDPAFDPRRTLNLGRMVEQWGAIPFAYLEQLSKLDYTYGYVGTEDFTMYPLLPPGTFIQVDESRNKVIHQGWRSEYERPIYFVETRDGHTCCWCAVGPEGMILQSHPLSPVPPIVAQEGEAEIIGQVVGVAMRLGDSHESSLDSSTIRKALPR